MNNPAAKYQRSDTTHRGLLTHQRGKTLRQRIMKRPRALINRCLPVQPLLPESGEIQLIVHQRHRHRMRHSVA
ncbi:Uncharacterised protein [Shigella sonnei]|nr:Uncharacterised protein [Shigella sonnei]